VEEDPRRGQAWVQLYRLQRLQGKVEAASQTLRNGRAALPFNRELLWAQAGEMEAVGDIDGAIANYELLYDRNSNDLVAANNLSSLLSNHKTDASSLERAWAVARRLNGTDVPAFQDTYGWLVFRRGQAEEALPYLESAAAELSQDPIVQFHLGQTYAALRRQEDAVAQYRLVLELAEDGDPRPQIAIARTEISRLETLSPAEE
jgi:tetratricopeptide (TPR) repeat protein